MIPPVSDGQRPMFRQLSSHVFLFHDLCNVYVIRDGDRAILIDSGSGSIVDHLGEIGVSNVEWVLHTHYHRDQVEGDTNLIVAGAVVAAPEREVHLLSSAEAFWQSVNFFDRYDCQNLFYCSLVDIPVEAVLRDYQTFRWRSYQFEVLPTPGHTKGSVTLVAEIDDLVYGFSGDLIAAPGRVHTLHDLQWDYVEADGLNVAQHSACMLSQKRLDTLAPSHGALIRNPERALRDLVRNLGRLHDVIAVRFEGDVQAPVPQSVVPRFLRVSKHIVAALHPSANFYILESDDGSTLFFDYGFPSRSHLWGGDCRFVEHSLVEAQQYLGLSVPEVVVPTHYHDDHVSGISYLQSRYSTEVWVHESFSDVLEFPSRYNLPCLWGTPVSVAKVVGDGVSTKWHEFALDWRHTPGHTWYAASVFAEIDGNRVAVTGDEVLRSAVGQLRGGGPIYRNRVEFDSFTTGIETLLKYEPDLILTGHSGPIRVTKADLDDAYRWATELGHAWFALASSPEDIGFSLDPDFVSIYPFSSTVTRGGEVTLDVHVRNHGPRQASIVIRLRGPEGWEVAPGSRAAVVDSRGSVTLRFAVRCPPNAEASRRHLVAAELSWDDEYRGSIAEAVILCAETARGERADRVAGHET